MKTGNAPGTAHPRRSGLAVETLQPCSPEALRPSAGQHGQPQESDLCIGAPFGDPPLAHRPGAGACGGACARAARDPQGLAPTRSRRITHRGYTPRTITEAPEDLGQRHCHTSCTQVPVPGVPCPWHSREAGLCGHVRQSPWPRRNEMSPPRRLRPPTHTQERRVARPTHLVATAVVAGPNTRHQPRRIGVGGSARVLCGSENHDQRLRPPTHPLERASLSPRRRIAD